MTHARDTHSDIPHSIDVDEVIQYQRELISSYQTEPDEDDTRGSLARHLSHLGYLLKRRYRKFGFIVDLEQATESYEKAVALLSKNDERRPRYLRDLAECLHRTFRAKDQVEDLNGAIDRLREAIACLSGGNASFDEDETQVARFLAILGGFLVDRYLRLSLIVDLKEASESYERAVALLSENDERRPLYLRDLAECLHRMFRAKDKVEDLNGAIDRLREAIACLSGGNAPLDEDETQVASLLSLLGSFLVDRYLRLSLIVDLKEATKSYRKALVLLPDNDERRPLYLRDLAESLHRMFRVKDKVEDLNGAIDRLREAIACLSGGNAPLDEDETQVAELLSLLGSFLVDRYLRLSLIVDLKEATKSYRKALVLLPDNDERRPLYLRDLAESLHRTFKAKNQVEDLNGAIDRLREAIACLSGGNAPFDEDETQVARLLNLLGAFLVDRYLRFSLIVDLEEATESYEKAVVLLPDSSERRPQYLRDLAVSLHRMFEAKNQVEDLNAAIDRLREVIACLDEGEILGPLAQDLNVLGDFLILRFWEVGLIVDLEQATESYRKALALLPENDERRPRYLRALAESLHLTSDTKGQIEDLNGAIDRVREALACLSNGIAPSDKGETCISLGFLASFLDARFKCTGERADLDEAIRCRYQAMELDPTKRYSALDNLSNHFFALYLVTRDLSDLERALGFSREALECCPVDDSFSHLQIKRHMASYLEGSDRVEDWEEGLKIRRELVNLTEGKDGHHDYVIDLAQSLHSQWRRDPRQLGPFEEGMKQFRDVLQAVHGPDRIDPLDKLVTSLHNRYEQSNAPEDLEEAITYLRELTALIPDGHVGRARHLSSLAEALRSRFSLFGRVDDIEDALDAAREAVAIARSNHEHHQLVQCLSTLAGCLSHRCIGLRRSDGIEEAIIVWREVVSLSPDNWNALRSLASSILLLGEADAIEEAIILLRKSLTIIPAGHPDKIKSLSALATTALGRCLLSDSNIEYQEEALEICRENVAAHEEFGLGDDYCLAVGCLAEACWINDDHEEAVTRYEQAVAMRYATPHRRFSVTTTWAYRAMQAGHSSSLRANTKALELLDQCLTSTPTIDLQHQFLTKNPSAFASNAAACAIEKEELETAVQVLEQGRALLWSHMRGYRHPIEKLQELNPGLAEEFKGVCQQLEHITVSSRPDLPGMPPIPISTAPYASHGLHFDAKMTKNRQLLEEYERLISEIRQLDGFSNFLQATPFSILQTAASEGPVILVNVNEHRSDAIILRATETPLLVPLPETLFAMVDTLSARLVVVDLINRDEDRKGVAHRGQKSRYGQHPSTPLEKCLPAYCSRAAGNGTSNGFSRLVVSCWSTECPPIACRRALQQQGRSDRGVPGSLHVIVHPNPIISHRFP
ncbi:hypothetical protein EW026_g8055 [Hermanssonia centrifuga]|uniref:Tetratricopeptide repeat protein n=1 Tax=Hermanssonia centrifuga TaxID=98765 RepID=A0A4S4K5P0_9APHY|nr:hypothetical protein EW026_g8055 [Hermanssonia centrifuga]